MRYQIVELDDFKEGRSLVIRLPEEEVDRNALYTMEQDMPPFLVPFSYRNIDGEVEISYKLGGRSKLQYFGGEKTAAEYCELFKKLMMPLNSCEDWFMDPFCFVLEPEHVYYQASTQAVSYLYIPATQRCADRDALVRMIKVLNKQFPAQNDKLRIRVLECLDDFQIQSFMQILKTGAAGAGSTGYQPPKKDVVRPKEERKMPPVDPKPADKPVEKKPVEKKPVDPVKKPPMDDDGDDLHIDLGGGKKPEKKPEKKEKKGLFGGLFATKEKNTQEMAEQLQDVGGDKPGFKPAMERRQRVYDDTPTYVEALDEKTQLKSRVTGQPRLVRTGDPSLPAEIRITASVGQVFKIGRFDVAVGKPQSHFEFAPNTKEVSRHHAAIERREDGYFIIDLGSAAGTSLNGTQIPANVPRKLTEGMNVSFGNAGADYVFRQ